MKKTVRMLLTAILVLFILLLTPSANASGLFLKKGSRGPDVTLIQQLLAEKGYLNHKATGYFGPLTSRAVIIFQQEHDLKVDGIIGPQTYNALTYSKTAASIDNSADNIQTPVKGEYLDWFEEVEDIFSIGKTAIITDIDTGISFKVMRTFGHLHADCETLSIEDTSTMKSIWNGFNWTRRAIIVTVEGRHIAASAIGMPHAGKDSEPALKTVPGRSGSFGKGQNYDKIKDNGMDGHFCIHFKNSTLHKNNKPDPEHQKMVKKAAGLL